MTQIIPTVGRKLYFYPQNDPSIARLDEQPVDATVVYVWPDPPNQGEGYHLLNLLVVDHSGRAHSEQKVPLVQEGDPVPPTSYAKWMPYQIGQAAKTDPNVQAAATISSTPAATSGSAVEESTPTSTGQDSDTDSGNVSADGEQSSATSSASASVSQPSSSQSEVSDTSSSPSQSTSGNSGGFGFERALTLLKSGLAVTRAGWAPGAFVYLVPAASYPAQTAIAKRAFPDGVVPYMAYLAIKRSDGNVCVFTPGVDSILADDWQVSR